MWGSQTIQQLPSERQNWQKRDTRAFLGFKAIFETGLQIKKKIDAQCFQMHPQQFSSTRL